jgi:glyoxylate/hydroxypyruvate reductase A
MVEPGIAQCMGEYVTHAVLSIQRNAIEYADAQARGEWRPLPARGIGGCAWAC